MKRHRFSPGLRRLKGFSLIELMVSVTIGLIITIAAFSAYLGASTASKIADAQARMNEDAQAALSILTQQLRMAGNNPAQPDRTDISRYNPVYNPYDSTTFVTNPTTASPSSFSIRGCDKTFSNITAASSLDVLSCPGGNNILPNSIAVSYEADISNSSPTTANLPTDCLGVKLKEIKATFSLPTPQPIPPIPSPAPGPYSYYVADNLFYINYSGAIPSLYCRGNGINSTPQPLVENIEDLQLSYGTMKASTTDADLKKAPVAGYLLANEINSATTVPNDPALWAKVITVRICVLVRSETPVVADASSARYYNCANPSQLVSAPDLRLRRAYSTTVVLRNRRL